MKKTSLILTCFLTAFSLFFISAGDLYSQEEKKSEEKSVMDISLGLNSYYSSYSSESDYIILPEFLLRFSGENVRGGFSYTGFMHRPVYDSESKRERIDINQAGVFLQGRELGGFEITCKADYAWGDRDYSFLAGFLGLGYSSESWKLNGFYSKSKSDYSFDSTNISLVKSAFGGKFLFNFSEMLDVTGEGRRDSFDYDKSDFTFSSNLLRIGFDVKMKYLDLGLGALYGYDSDEYRFPGADASVSVSLFENIRISIAYSFAYYISPGSDDDTQLYTPVDYMKTTGSTYSFRQLKKSGGSFASNLLSLSVSFHF